MSKHLGTEIEEAGEVEGIKTEEAMGVERVSDAGGDEDTAVKDPGTGS